MHVRDVGRGRQDMRGHWAEADDGVQKERMWDRKKQRYD